MCVVQFLAFYLVPLFIFHPQFIHADVHIVDWDHDHHHTHSENWEGTCTAGQRQSPIDIESDKTIKEKWGQPFVFHGYEKNVPMHVKNNRHSIVVEYSDHEDHHKDIWIRGGGLGESKFSFAQLHFHWGSTNDQGSEHTIDGKAAPMEMHIVHWNLDVGKDVKEATQKDSYNSFEVLGVLFKIGKKNLNYEHFFNATRKVAKQNTNSTLEKGARLKDLLPADTNAFYRYKGSLTTPPCNEIVMWTIFKEPIEISQDQIDVLRKAYYHREGETEPRGISNNYRLTQKVYEREVLEVDTHIVHLDCAHKGSSRFKVADNPEGFDSTENGSKSINISFKSMVFIFLISYIYACI